MANANPDITGDILRELFVAGTRCVEAHVEEINSLNVFPVPDGDTGINMLLTMLAANEAKELPPPGQGDVAEVSRALARGALLGARGNSGVIFSQFMRGFSQGLADVEVADGAAISAALVRASSASYEAVGKPVEGTMLSVMRAAAEAVEPLVGAPTEVLRKALAAAESALVYTPEQLPILKEAGVVDAGGQGMVAFMTGALAFLEGTEADLVIAAPAAGTVDAASVKQEFLEHTEEEMYGYCTQFIIQGEAMDVDAMRERVMALAGSTVVVGDDRTVRVHAHAEDPGPLLSMGVSYGALDQVSVQNMDDQHQEFMERHGYTPGEQVDLAVVAVAPGEGIERVFADLGAARIVRGGQTMNPSTADLLDAIKMANATHTVVLPNNSNIVLAANQAAELAETKVTVVPSSSVPQGIAALLAFNPDQDAEANVGAMKSALDDTQSGEVTKAVRSTSINGVAVTEGQTVALLDGEIVAAVESPEQALIALIEHAGARAGALVTLYYGAEVKEESASAAANEIASRFDGVETEVMAGGQPHYDYLVSIE
jgi:DAK2 domain fusion protein YloV